MTTIKDRTKSVVFMFAMAALLAGVLSGIRVVTAAKVEDNRKFAATRSIVEVLELADDVKALSGQEMEKLRENNIRKFWVIGSESAPQLVDTEPGPQQQVLYTMWAAVDDQGKPTAYAFKIGGKGFWGPVWGLMSVATDGETIRHVVWTDQAETPGLGARIEEKAYREKFRGKLASDPSVHRFTVVPEGTMGDDPHKIDQITGASETTVRGMGHFLNDNFAKWHKYYPLLAAYFAKQS